MLVIFFLLSYYVLFFPIAKRISMIIIGDGGFETKKHKRFVFYAVSNMKKTSSTSIHFFKIPYC